MTELCRVWADLAADPENTAAVAAARARLVDLVWHVPGCDTCAVISEAMPFPDRVFAVLGDENLDLSPEELQEIRAMDDVLPDDRNAIPDAVEFLLAGLPGLLRTPAAEPLQIFDAIDAVDRLVHRVAGGIPRATIAISSGGVRCDGVPVASRATAIAEIARVADVPEAVAQALWRWQLEAAEYCPTLYPGLVMTKAENGVLEAEFEKPTATADLITRWQVRDPVPSKTQFLDVLAELKEAVAAGTRLLATLKQKGFGPFVERVAVENAKIVEMVDAVGGTDVQEDEGRQAAPTSMPTILAYLRNAERKKQRCLRAIAKAPAATIGRGEVAEKLRTFAAERQAVAGRNIIEIERLRIADCGLRIAD
jgi:hypothetical protein